jgi:hypothetical protein
MSRQKDSGALCLVPVFGFGKECGSKMFLMVDFVKLLPTFMSTPVKGQLVVDKFLGLRNAGFRG